MTSRSQVSPDNLCSVNVTVIIYGALHSSSFISVLPPTLTAKSSSTQDSSCHLQDRTYMRMTTVTLMVMAKVARTLITRAGTQPRRSAGQTKRSVVSCLTANQLTPPRCPPPSLRVCPGTHSPTHRSQHPLSHPSLPAPTLPPIAPTTHSPTHRSQHPLSHPSLPAPTLPPIAPSTHCHLPPHSNPPRLG